MTKRISGRVALLISGLGVLMILVVGWLMFIGPEQSKASDLDSQVASVQTQVSDARQLIAGPARRQSLASLHQLQEVMPDQVEMSAILKQLSGFAQTAQIELDTITPQTPTITGGEQLVPMTVAVTGHYFAIQRFLRLLRASADLHNGRLVATGRLYTVDGIQFTSAPTGGVVTANLTINGFIYTPPVTGEAPVSTPSLSNTSATSTGP